MTMKTNKSYSKRFKISKAGALSSRKSGQNHFNAKERQSTKSAKKKAVKYQMSNKDRSRFLVNM